MLSSLLPPELFQLIESMGAIQNLYEIRIRFNAPIVLNFGGKQSMLRNTLQGNKIVHADGRLIDYIICRATGSSLYSYNNQIKQGFVTFEGGIRIGITGEIVVDENDRVKTVKNFSSLCIRIPHEIFNCSATAINFILGKEINNTLIIAPPGAGKTTILRDIARQISGQSRIFNTLIIDERYEIAFSMTGLATMDIGCFSDVISGSSKRYGFSEGIRSLRPDVIICDELATYEDVLAVKFAVNSGVKVIASAHSNSHLELRKNTNSSLFLMKKFFPDILSFRVEMVLEHMRGFMMKIWYHCSQYR